MKYLQERWGFIVTCCTRSAKEYTSLLRGDKLSPFTRRGLKNDCEDWRRLTVFWRALIKNQEFWGVSLLNNWILCDPQMTGTIFVSLESGSWQTYTVSIRHHCSWMCEEYWSTRGRDWWTIEDLTTLCCCCWSREVDCWLHGQIVKHSCSGVYILCWMVEPSKGGRVSGMCHDYEYQLNWFVEDAH